MDGPGHVLGGRRDGGGEQRAPRRRRSPPEPSPSSEFGQAPLGSWMPSYLSYNEGISELPLEAAEGIVLADSRCWERS
ncbi:MAG: hypothetical protein MZV64_67935 [Ignavibacteriales bacterium]|nr:hypothetical protein [Ignavibacteriales bacterium]